MGRLTRVTGGADLEEKRRHQLTDAGTGSRRLILDQAYSHRAPHAVTGRAEAANKEDVVKRH